MHIFTDSSVNVKYNKAIGCYLVLDDLQMKEMEITVNYNDICYLDLNSNSSTLAELETIKYILSKYCTDNNIYLYTDCSNIINLYNKRTYSKSHKHAELYKILLDYINNNNINIIKVKGHSKKSDRLTIEEVIFSVVDKAARKRLRSTIK
ncbi:ribonuclease H [Fadolivirus algeromassiliense]|jgi:hypothetical protein|uniref:Ribonuclease H n=1 Tax=Fadolivirus FV1/VV64 TaxID=3070911 RepID=A0A7D3QWB8_9VIRU|nr:ribonuclease H [Fadolivirus algeromassiliense]QKF94326.1 ribonuclease H [Fadolivirus FV1/VV64]